jgi:uncharacterized protein (DUF3084 family)
MDSPNETAAPPPAPPHEGAPFTVRHVTQLVLKLPVGALFAVLVGAISLVGGLFGAGYRTATYFHDPALVEQRLLTEKDALQAQADKFRDLAAERMHHIESLSSAQKSLTERFDQFVLDTGKTLAALKDDTVTAAQQAAAAARERDQILAARVQDVQRLTDTVKDREQALQQRDQTIAGLNQSLAARAQDVQKAADALRDRDAALQQRDQTIAGLNQSLSARSQEAQRLGDALKERDAAVQQRDQSLTARGQEVQRLTALLKERDQTIAALKAEAAAGSGAK